MQTKHFVNDPDAFVASALKSFGLIRPDLSLDLEYKILYSLSRKDGHGQVSIISGGGSGHEPSFMGFVGEGLLTAAVAGTIFASPSSRQVLTAIEAVDGSKGILVTVMNYTGDVLNFGVALEKAKASTPALKIEMLVVGNDVDVVRNRAGKVGGRGIAGTMLVHKVTGAMAAAGYGLEDIVRVGRLVADNLGSIGVSLNRVHVPGRPREENGENSLGSDEVELGMGIHNETGCGRKSGANAKLPVVIKDMLRQLLDSNDSDRNFLPTRANEMVLMVNNLGALSVLELGAVVSEVVEQLRQQYNTNLVRVFAGTFMTSLDGLGFSISLLNVVNTGIKESLIELLDAASNAIGWHATARSDGSTSKECDKRIKMRNSGEIEEQLKSHLRCELEAVTRRLRAGLQAIDIFSNKPSEKVFTLT